MFFRLLTLYVVASILSGCSYFFEDKKRAERLEKTTAFHVPLNKEQCFSEWKDIATDYFRGQDNKLQKITNCLNESLQKFSEHSRERDGNQSGIAIKDVQRFVDEFVNKTPVRTSTWNNIKKLKASILGGDPERITDAERLQLEQISQKGVELSHQLDPYIKIYRLQVSLDPHNESDRKKLFLAVAALQNVAREFGLLIQSFENRPSLNFSDFLDFLESISETELAQFLVEKKGFLLSLNQILLGQSKNEIPISKSVEFLTAFAKAYSIRMKFRYLLEEKNMFPNMSTLFTYLVRFKEQLSDDNVFAQQQLEDFKNLQSELFELLEVAIAKNRGGSGIRLDELIELLRQMGSNGLLDNTISTEAYLSLVDPFVNHWTRSLSGHSTDQLTLASIQHMRFEFDIWTKGQEAINTIFNPSASVLKTEKVITALKTMQSQQSNSIRLNELIEVLNKKMVLSWHSSQALRMATIQPDSFLTRRDLVMMNTLRTITRLVFFAYSNDPTRATNMDKLTDQEFQNFYSDLRKVGIELQVMDPRVYNSGLRSFIEANLFTSQGQDLNWLDPYETMEFLSLVISSGLTANKIYDLAKTKCQTPEPGIWQRMRLDQNCALDTIARERKTIFNGFVHMLKDSNLMDNSEAWAQLTQRVTTAAREIDEGSPWDFSELKTWTTIVHYVENLMIKYDLDLDNQLSSNEVAQSVNLFLPYIRKLKKDEPLNPPSTPPMTISGQLEALSATAVEFVKHWLYLGAFNYLTQYQEIPELNDNPTTGDKFQYYFNLASKGLIEDFGTLDRLAIAETVAQLAASNRRKTFLELESDFTLNYKDIRLSALNDSALNSRFATDVLHKFYCQENAFEKIRDAIKTHPDWLPENPPSPPAQFRLFLTELKKTFIRTDDCFFIQIPTPQY